MLRSTWARRKNFKSKGKWIDGVQKFATEGTCLTVIAKVNYDVTNDEFILKDSLGLVGGGLKESIELLKDRYSMFYTYSRFFVKVGAGILFANLVLRMLLHWRKRK